jgi:NTE family protein
MRSGVQGGGALGAYQLGVLKHIHREVAPAAHSPFRVFVGSSAGSLNAGFLACRSHDARDAILELESLWRSFHVPAYYGNPLAKALRSQWWRGLLRRHRRTQWSLLPASHLQDIVESGFSRSGLDRATEAGSTLGVAVAATEFQTASQVWFTEGTAARESDNGVATILRVRLMAHHLVASCSVPLVFPLVRIGERFYSDGDVAHHDPLGVAIGMGARRILHIGMRARRPRDAAPLPDDHVPTVGEVMRMLQHGMRYDQATMQAGWLEVLNYFHARLPADSQPAIKHDPADGSVDLDSYRPVEVELFRPSEPLDVLASSPKATGRTPGGLRFHKDYIAQLIELGESDAAARHDQLTQFFDPARPQRVSRFEKPSPEA